MTSFLHISTKDMYNLNGPLNIKDGSRVCAV
jgi:hypothetical protein